MDEERVKEFYSLHKFPGELRENADSGEYSLGGLDPRSNRGFFALCRERRPGLEDLREKIREKRRVRPTDQMTSGKNARINKRKSPRGKVSSLTAALRGAHRPMRSLAHSQVQSLWGCECEPRV